MGLEHSKSIETSQIPIEITKAIDQTYLSYFSLILDLPVTFNNTYQGDYFFVNLTQMITQKSSFVITIGSIPQNSSDILIGEGLFSQLGLKNIFPQNISLNINNYTVNKTITGVFEDDGPWYYGFLEDISHYWSNITYVSGFEFQMKNDQVISAFHSSINSFITSTGYNIGIDFIDLQQTQQFTQSFYNQLKTLFLYLFYFLSILLFLKLFHSGYTLVNRFHREFWICKAIGMSNWQLRFVFWQMIAFIGNIGILFGIFLGILSPEILLYFLKFIFSGQNLTLIPAIDDLILVFVVSNIQFVIISILTFRVRKHYIGE